MGVDTEMTDDDRKILVVRNDLGMKDMFRQSCEEFRVSKKYTAAFIIYIIMEFSLGVEFC